jgi:aminoglycoside phosphotransferase (APT) family kinase protein
MRQPDSDYQLLHKIAARVLPGTSSLTVTRTATGVSTPVYRIQRGTITLYLRLAESPEDNLAPDVFVHQVLCARGVRVPEIVHFEPFNEELGRSLMVTTEIAGQPMDDHYHSTTVEEVLTSAGRDLALINDIPVDGFGWILRDRPEGAPLAAGLPTLQALALEDLEKHLTDLSMFLGRNEIQVIHHTISEFAFDLKRDQAVLVHGDFDLSHIFHLAGRYTGVIDFGEIRGADRFYDLGYYALHDGEKIPFPTLQWIIAGYHDISPLPPDAPARIALWSLIIGIRSLSRSVNRAPSLYQAHLINAIRRALESLAAQ